MQFTEFRFKDAVCPLIVMLVFVSSCSHLASRNRFNEVREPGLSLAESVRSYDEVSRDAAEALKNGRYSEIENAASDSRMKKTRLVGGYWKLHAIYRGMQSPNFKQNASDAEWDAHLTRLKEWKQNMPNSITARVALASAWITYGSEARGSGFADTVSADNWRLFEKRYTYAHLELKDAEKVPEKCPEWFNAMIAVGIAQGWTPARIRNVFEQAFELEPVYYPVHRTVLIYLLPQWYGEPGMVADFITESADRVTGDESDILYYILFTTMQPTFRGDIFYEVPLSWERLRSGYDLLQKRYDVDNYRKNQYAYIALYSKDVDASISAFEAIDENWDSEVWASRSQFEKMRDGLKKMREMKELSNQAASQAARTPPQNQ